MTVGAPNWELLEIHGTGQKDKNTSGENCSLTQGEGAKNGSGQKREEPHNIR